MILFTLTIVIIKAKKNKSAPALTDILVAYMLQ